MAELIKIFWRDIPSQVMAKAGRKAERVLLPTRFQEGIDRAAMRAGKGTSEAYMEDWVRHRAPITGDLATAAREAAAALEAEFDEEFLERIVKAKGIKADVKE